MFQFLVVDYHMDDTFSIKKIFNGTCSILNLVLSTHSPSATEKYSSISVWPIKVE